MEVLEVGGGVLEGGLEGRRGGERVRDEGRKGRVEGQLGWKKEGELERWEDRAREKKVVQARMISCAPASECEMGDARDRTTPRYRRGRDPKVDLRLFLEKRRDVFRRDLPPSIPSFNGIDSIEPPCPSIGCAKSIH